MKSDFILEVSDLHWIRDVDDENDLCAHGKVFLKIGNEIVCDKESLDVTVSSTALYLMRTLTQDYKKGDFASQILPCCGFVMISESEESDFVNICGCSTGIDWKIEHIDNSKIKHTTENGESITVDFEDYKTLVKDFFLKVDEFYRKGKPKKIPTDDFYRKGFLSFQNEWEMLKKQL